MVTAVMIFEISRLKALKATGPPLVAGIPVEELAANAPATTGIGQVIECWHTASPSDFLGIETIMKRFLTYQKCCRIVVGH